MLSISIRLAVFTASSALPFDEGKETDDNLCHLTHLSRKALVSCALNSGPPSLEISVGTPNVTSLAQPLRTSLIRTDFDLLDFEPARQSVSSDEVVVTVEMEVVACNRFEWCAGHRRFDWWSARLGWHCPVTAVAACANHLNIFCDARPIDLDARSAASGQPLVEG